MTTILCLLRTACRCGDSPQVGDQAQIDVGTKAGSSNAELEEIRQLKKENRDLNEVNEILKKASIFIASELHPRHR